MKLPGAGTLTRKFGLTLLCVLAARGCASDLERAAASVSHQVVPTPAPIVRYEPHSVHDTLKPYHPPEVPYAGR